MVIAILIEKGEITHSIRGNHGAGKQSCGARGSDRGD
jgi:hypothetical protein